MKEAEYRAKLPALIGYRA